MLIILFIIVIAPILLGFLITALLTFLKCRVEGKKEMEILAANKKEIDALFHEH